MTHPVASDTVVPIESNALRAGRTFKRAPALTPGRGFHALTEAGSDTTMCGLDASTMHTFDDVVWESTNLQHACEECRSALA